MTLAEVISDIHILNRELEVYEEKYGVLSKDFYQLYIQGKLPDEEIEQIDEYGRWAAIYESKLELEDRFQEVLAERLGEKAGSDPVYVLLTEKTP